MRHLPDRRGVWLRSAHRDPGYRTTSSLFSMRWRSHNAGRSGPARRCGSLCAKRGRARRSSDIVQMTAWLALLVVLLGFAGRAQVNTEQGQAPTLTNPHDSGADTRGGPDGGGGGM